MHRWLRQVSVGMVDAKNRLLESQLYASIASLVQFMATPLLIDGEATYCPALRYLPNAAGEGLLFRLGQFLEASENRMASDRLRSFYGDFLESYVTDFMREATRSRGCSILYGSEPSGRARSVLVTLPYSIMKTRSSSTLTQNDST